LKAGRVAWGIQNMQDSVSVDTLMPEPRRSFHTTVSQFEHSLVMYHYIKAVTSALNIEIDCNECHLISILKITLHLEELIDTHPLKVVNMSKPNPVLRKPIMTDEYKLTLDIPVCFGQ
jgi:hypothetical protein